MQQMDEDDFIRTISDNESAGVVHSESDSEPAASRTVQRKRKRPNSPMNVPVKPKKKARTSQEDCESESEEDIGAKDDAINSDIEFDFGTFGDRDVIEDFDGWGVETEAVDSRPTFAKQSVDIDEIIARRIARKSKKSAEDIADQVSRASSASSEEDASSIDNEEGVEIDFDSKELAQNGFGVDAESDEEAESPVMHATTSPPQDDESDEEEAASPVPHPDDDVSEGDDDEEEDSPRVDAVEQAKQKAFFAADQNTSPALDHSMSFHQFSLSRPILRALAALSFSLPTPIQTRTIPVALQGLDVVGSAETGSGKTAAFLLPIFERLLYRPRKVPTTRVAILMPTRELAVQCYSVATALARYTDITLAQVVGGFSLREQEVILKKRPDVVIATPGRFIDHMRNSPSFTVETLEILVLDEADRMLEQGFADELDEILRTIPRSRQTMLFSATMTSSVDKLVRVGMNKPVRISVDTTLSTVSGLSQEFLRLRPGKEDLRLASLCTLVTSSPDYQERTIIFLRQKRDAHRVRIIFHLLGLKASELHGSMTQEQRISSVNAFRDGKTTHLLATDVASRGLDIKNVRSVINYEAPQTHEIYLHRVGRTARAGKTGRALTIAAEPDRKIVKAAVKSARSQGAKVSSRVLDADSTAKMSLRLDQLADEIEAVLKEEKQEKQIAQMESEVTRGQNMIRHHDEIMSKPMRTWFESEKEKQAAKDRAKEEMGLTFRGEKKKLSNKDKKKLDLHREHKEGRSWKKGRDDTKARKTVNKKGGRARK